MKKFTLLSACYILSINIVINGQSDFNQQKLAVFKNGTAFCVKTGNLNVKDKTCILNNTPDALFGTLWAGAKNGQIKGMNTLKTKTTEPHEVLSIKDMVTGNVGKRAKVVLYNEAAYDAEILSVNGSVVTLNTKERWVTTELSSIKTVEFYEKPNLTYNMETDKNQLALEFDSDGNKEVSLMYLMSGISWFPSYLITIDDKSNADIVLRSTLVNDAEDLENAVVDFVVGVPNFKYNNLSSPLTSKQSLAEFIANLNYSRYSSYNYNAAGLSNAIMTQQAYGYGRADVADEGDVTQEVLPEARNSEDLYFYTYKDVNIKKGERKTFDLIDNAVTYEHVYETELKPNSSSGYYSGSNYDDENNKVWHSIKLKNSSDKPWTTGTVLIMKGEGSKAEPLSQDMLKYTPPKGESLVKITEATDVSVKDSEEEVKRVEKQTRYNNYYYDLVTIDGEIVIRNYKNKEITLKIKRDIYGKLQESSLEWESTKMPAAYNRGLDPLNYVSWEITMKPSEERKIRYSYTIYISR
ncbi:MAG: hypothetical protein JXB49_20755 [Bacteroidales bacterium]|nr:hypothetical protein [Bacteroidales bacterium]